CISASQCPHSSFVQPSSPTRRSSDLALCPEGVAMVTCQVNGVMLGTERFGDRSAPLILCVGGPTMPQSSPAGSATDPLIWPEWRSEEHTSELQSRFDIVCRLLLEKKT